MNKRTTVYGLIWALCLGLFNLIVFVTPSEIGGVSKFTGGFWVGYIFITLAFIGQLVCGLYALKEKNLQKLFYRISLISISYGSLIAMLIAGAIFLAIPVLPAWIGIIVCAIVLVFNVVSILKAVVAVSIVSAIDDKIKAQTFFMKDLAVDAQCLMNAAKTATLRALTKQVYEEVRYSDTMSNDALATLEAQLAQQFTAFSNAVEAEDDELSKECADIFLALLNKRNQKCKLLK